jgi:prepilin-type N-terminal cleavage/methylation domain-containing protein
MSGGLNVVSTRLLSDGWLGSSRRRAPRNRAPCAVADQPCASRPGSNSRPSRVAPRRSGFTLLEVLLTLMLASLVLVVLGMAVDFQLRVVDRGRGDVEEAQLARVLLHRIANDLRGAIPYDPLDIEGLVAEVIASTADSAEEAVAAYGDAGSAEGAEDSSRGGSSEGSSQDSQGSQNSAPEASDSEPTEDAESDQASGTGESVLPRSVPGLYGESEWLQVDVGRLPRLDQFDYLLTQSAGSTTVDRLSDVKTVTYYVVPPEEGAVDLAADVTESSSGLVRRELDRAVASYGSEAGQPDMESDAAPLAPEVSAIAFRYYDGTEWVDSWDSAEAGSLPAAVEITISIMPFGRQRTSSWQRSTSDYATEEEATVTRSLIVHLRAAAASSGGGTSDETSDETEATTETSESASNDSDSPSEEATR